MGGLQRIPNDCQVGLLAGTCGFSVVTSSSVNPQGVGGREEGSGFGCHVGSPCEMPEGMRLIGHVL